jgi:hydroxymethylglutaryl-CoA lyase
VTYICHLIQIHYLIFSALSCGVSEVAVFTAASEYFCQKNTNCSIAESIERFQPIMESAKQNNVKVRGYINIYKRRMC